MRLRHKKGAENDILNTPFCINSYKNGSNFTYIDYFDLFKNDKPVHLELGMGKGSFITKMSKKYDNVNFIGIEKSATIVLKAIDNLIKNSDENIIDYYDEKLLSSYNNLRFMCEDIENLDKIFKDNTIDKIYLNFSDPWPKKRHENRRLTHSRFLSIYEKLLKKGSILEFKTDNLQLFEFSLEEIKNSNFDLIDYTFDLHNDTKLNVGNIMTEYEEKFSKKGNKICKLIAKI